MKRSAVVALIGVAVLAGLGYMYWSGIATRSSGALMLRPDDARTLALGRQVYQERCAACHGAKLEGQADWRRRGADGLLPAPPHDAQGHTWHHPDETLFRITKFGVAKVANSKDYATSMPIYEGVLSDEQIVAVLSWIKSQWPPDIRARHDQMNQRARAAPAP
jgi:mono/diheme cytochrome c family protein